MVSGVQKAPSTSGRDAKGLRFSSVLGYGVSPYPLCHQHVTVNFPFLFKSKALIITFLVYPIMGL